MPDLTPNLNLKKPNWDTDVADIRVFNDNMDIIDEKVATIDESLENLGDEKQNKEDSSLFTTVKNIVGAINELFSNKLDKGGYTGTAQNLLTEISKKASKTQLGRIIIGKGLTTDSDGRTSIVSKNDGITINDNDIQLNVYNGVDSTSTTRAGSANAVKQAYDNANGRVSKSGDTMTNTLNIKKSGTKVINFQEGDNTQTGYVGFGTSGSPRELQFNNVIVGEAFVIGENKEYQFPTRTIIAGEDLNKIIPTQDRRGFICRVPTLEIENLPDGASYGFLRVWRNSVNQILQEYHQTSSTYPRVWRRAGTSESIFGAWKLLAFDEDKYSINGGILNGTPKIKGTLSYLEFLNMNEERRGWIGFGSSSVNTLGIVHDKMLDTSKKGSLSITENASLIIPYENISGSGVDINNLICETEVSIKYFRIISLSTVNNGLNFPVGASHGIVKTTRTYESQQTQEYYSVGNGKRFIRYYTTSWSKWQEILSDTSDYYLGNSGISSVIFIQDTGAKTRNNGYLDKVTKKLYICSPKDPSVNSVNDTTITKNFRLATNIENAKEPITIMKFTRKELPREQLITIIADNEINNYSRFDEIEFVVDYDGTGECALHRVYIGSILEAYEYQRSQASTTEPGRVCFYVFDISQNRVEIRYIEGNGITIKSGYSDAYMAYCRIIKHY